LTISAHRFDRSFCPTSTKADENIVMEAALSLKMTLGAFQSVKKRIWYAKCEDHFPTEDTQVKSTGSGNMSDVSELKARIEKADIACLLKTSPTPTKPHFRLPINQF
jgi:hypothetical protein